MPTSQDTAAMIAVLLDRDPVMAGEIKKHISEARLAELLGISPRAFEKPADATELPGGN